MINDQKFIVLQEYLISLGNIAVAFSGGLDSTFLLTVASKSVKAKVIALTLKTPYIPDWELDEAKKTCIDLKIEHIIIESGIPEDIRNNPPERCYMCKSFVFSRFKGEAKKYGAFELIDGTNKDDISDYRPGLKALNELGIKSPLLECDLTKEDIRKFSKMLGIISWNKPAYACLLTRIPYNTDIKEPDLLLIEKGELFLHKLGFTEARLRLHNKTARIEIGAEKMDKFMNPELRLEIVNELKRLGCLYVSLDLEGYRTGSMNNNI